METTLLKLVSIRSKGHKRRLLLNHQEQDAFCEILKPLVKNHLMVINTNLGLDVYYHSLLDQQELILDTFIMCVAQKDVSKNDFHFKSINTTAELKEETRSLFLRLIGMPLFFKSYSKSLFRQLGFYFESNPVILSALFSIWQEQLMVLNAEEASADTFKPFLCNLQRSYINHKCHPDLKHLLEDALVPLHLN